LLFGFAGFTALGCMALLALVFHVDGFTPIELALLLLYGVLVGWIALSFWNALSGFVLLLLQRFKAPALVEQPLTLGSEAPPLTAIIMPVHNEDAREVFARIQAMRDDLTSRPEHDRFEFFVLSDSRDPDVWLEEELRWSQLPSGPVPVHYRHREDNAGRKSGNIEEFVRRWGGHYRYMIVLDADSLMSAETLIEMVRRMECSPKLGLIQVPPVPVNRGSLFARANQFAGAAYGPLFTTGLAFWQGNEANYWGHNAIIRVAPFAAHCGLPRLPGKPPFGGDILSHDFVEAALLRRAGWQVQLAPDLAGSYEELPPTLIDFAKRDRRWCQGNLQHSRVVFTPGLHPVSRFHMLSGIMSYLASPLWLLFLVLTGAQAYILSRTEPVYFFGDHLFPRWPVSYTVEMTTVLGVTLAMLFLPKVLAVVIQSLRDRRGFGGVASLTASTAVETLLSALLAPVLMLFQTRFVTATLGRTTVSWATQNRSDEGTGWLEALTTHWPHTTIGIVAAWAAYKCSTLFFWWLTPVLLGLWLAVPVSVFTSRAGSGLLARRLRLFLTPAELTPDAVIRGYHRWHEQMQEVATTHGEQSRFVQVAADPYLQAVHLSLLEAREPGRRRRSRLKLLIDQMLEEGWGSLSDEERLALLSDQDSVQRLSALYWSRPVGPGLDHHPPG
jgi:membrane glycosyltransferase